MNEPRMFKIMKGANIPWAMIAPHEHQAVANHYQSLECLHERGGLSPCEALAVLQNRPWSKDPQSAHKLEIAAQAWKTVHWHEPRIAELETERDQLRARVAELEAECSGYKHACYDLHWMARRYADGRRSYAPSMLNDRTRFLLKSGVELAKPHFARDGMGRDYDNLTDEEAAAAEKDMPRMHELEQQLADERLKSALATARRDALEEAAQVCDEERENALARLRREKPNSTDWLLFRHEAAVYNCAIQKIRTLAQDNADVG